MRTVRGEAGLQISPIRMLQRLLLAFILYDGAQNDINKILGRNSTKQTGQRRLV